MGVCFSKSGLRVHSASTHYYLPPAQRSCFGCYTTCIVHRISIEKNYTFRRWLCYLVITYDNIMKCFWFCCCKSYIPKSVNETIVAVLHIDANKSFSVPTLCTTASLLLSDRFFFNWKPIWTRLRNEPELIYVYWKAIK